MPQRAAIVTTLRDAGSVLDSYIKYHHSLGFEHFFLFFDDPEDPALEQVSNVPYVTAIPNDEVLQQRWKWTNLYQTDHIRKSLNEHLARQLLNTELAISWAMEMGMQWLLHIDVDELFYSPPGYTVEQHFQSLYDQGIRLTRYVNYEGVPESRSIENYFKEVTLFKKNPVVLPGKKLSPEEKEIIKDIPQVPDELFFNFYGNGKSAAYLCNGLMPQGPHEFHLPHHLEELSEPHNSDDFIILHYPCCGFEAFWMKYVTLGKFSDKFLGVVDIKAAVGTFHLEARDVVCSGHRDEAMKFYESRLMINNKADIQKLIESQLACRIMEPSETIAKL